jgi:hypothetical protein
MVRNMDADIKWTPQGRKTIIRQKIFLILLVLGTASGWSGCNTDDCEPGSCLNGGTCVAGGCVCPVGYTGIDCGTVDDNVATINSTVRFMGTFDGQEFILVEGQDGIGPFSMATGDWGAVGQPSQRIYAAGVGNSSTGVAAQVKKGTLAVEAASVTLSQFRSFWALGYHSYSIGAVQGVEVSITDTTGTLWSSGHGWGSQTASSAFIITHSVSEETPQGNMLKLRIEVKCRLYDDAGNPKELEGVFVLMPENVP